jgi:hypothetical protein
VRSLRACGHPSLVAVSSFRHPPVVVPDRIVAVVTGDGFDGRPHRAYPVELLDHLIAVVVFEHVSDSGVESSASRPF